MSHRIIDARARRIYDSRGRDTLEVDVVTAAGVSHGRAPAGASRGRFEAVAIEVAAALTRFETEVRPLLIGEDCRDQARIDLALVALDGSADRSRLGGNTLIATSSAVLRAAARAEGAALWRYLAPGDGAAMPLPEIQIIGGGAHAARRIDLQDIMAVPVGAPDWATALDWCARLYHSVGELVPANGVADEGGHWPAFARNEESLSTMVRGMERAGLEPGRDVAISLDVAANQLRVGDGYRIDGEVRSAAEWNATLTAWARTYPILMVEDPFAEDDEAPFADFSAGFAGLVVGDDHVVTRADRIAAATAARRINAALIKPNQAGTLTEARAALDACVAASAVPIVSARSGETEDTLIVDLAVGWQAPMLKVGSIARGERTAKWNEGLRIAEQLEGGGRLHAGPFPWNT